MRHHHIRKKKKTKMWTQMESLLVPLSKHEQQQKKSLADIMFAGKPLPTRLICLIFYVRSPCVLNMCASSDVLQTILLSLYKFAIFFLLTMQRHEIIPEHTINVT